MKKKERMTKLVSLVLQELEENPETRRDDTILVLNVLKRLGVDVKRPYEELAQLGYLKKVESITRAKRKALEENPRLRDPEWERIRRVEEEEYHDLFAYELKNKKRTYYGGQK